MAEILAAYEAPAKNNRYRNPEKNRKKDRPFLQNLSQQFSNKKLILNLNG